MMNSDSSVNRLSELKDHGVGEGRTVVSQVLTMAAAGRCLSPGDAPHLFTESRAQQPGIRAGDVETCAPFVSQEAAQPLIPN